MMWKGIPEEEIPTLGAEFWTEAHRAEKDS